MTIRFKLDPAKAVQAIHFLAAHKPGITQYYVGKVLFFADREHLLDWGRPITGDRYIAMEHGPVPSFVRDVLKDPSDEPDEIADDLGGRLEIRPDGNKRQVYSRRNEPADFDLLSHSDREYLLTSLERYGSMSFGKLRALSHEDAAYSAAWAQAGISNEMDVRLWLADLDDKDAAIEQIVERSEIDRTATRRNAA